MSSRYAKLTKVTFLMALAAISVDLETSCFCVFHVFLCLFIVGRVTFCVFDVFSLICFELSVPVQVIAWKDSSPK